MKNGCTLTMVLLAVLAAGIMTHTHCVVEPVCAALEVVCRDANPGCASEKACLARSLPVVGSTVSPAAVPLAAAPAPVSAILPAMIPNHNGARFAPSSLVSSPEFLQTFRI